MANSSFDKIGITDSMGLCYDNSAKQVLLLNFPSMIEFPPCLRSCRSLHRARRHLNTTRGFRGEQAYSGTLRSLLLCNGDLKGATHPDWVAKQSEANDGRPVGEYMYPRLKALGRQPSFSNVLRFWLGGSQVLLHG